MELYGQKQWYNYYTYSVLLFSLAESDFISLIQNLLRRRKKIFVEIFTGIYISIWQIVDKIILLFYTE